MKNLKAEMAKCGVTVEAIAEVLKIHRNSASNKINGKSSFTIEEAFEIKTVFFPTLSLDYLFANSADQHEAKTGWREMIGMKKQYRVTFGGLQSRNSAALFARAIKEQFGFLDKYVFINAIDVDDNENGILILESERNLAKLENHEAKTGWR